MDYVFEIVDKTERKIHLTKERWNHILKHPNMDDSIEKIKKALENPTTIRYNENDEKVRYYYLEFKSNYPSERYLLISVKYLNNHGFIITSFFTNKITGIKWKVK
ncbi:hypothetical protein COU54_05095 [Candidatus Pacearchaeota archaeon CG10_big_fil_rev_8_21_14_0_10_31_24]|nr:MAG: hypothetical protein COU54_05095 [Candidatus Pacearchaeota archaeon CG10_big_fil_rev_8_21_14_0_10_31_24]